MIATNKITIKVKANKSKRTLTIRKIENNKVYVKYRTYKLNKEEFESCLNNTSNDWQYFLNNSNDYYKL
nr:hypothetical protein [uncultured Flavobacterium sp.]